MYSEYGFVALQSILNFKNSGKRLKSFKVIADSAGKKISKKAEKEQYAQVWQAVRFYPGPDEK